jgi:uncharacterized alpha-E superfamily protein
MLSFDGAAHRTMLRGDAYWFIQLGAAIERADNTARLLDVKFHAADSELFGAGMAPRFMVPGPGLQWHRQGNGTLQVQTLGGMTQAQSQANPVEYDFYHWSAILRSVSGFEVYRKVYRNVILPEKVAELLILREDMPRSLAASVHEVLINLRRVANEQSADTLRLAGRLRADLQYGRIDEILATGLHAFLTQFLERVYALGAGISRDFLVPVAA